MIPGVILAAGTSSRMGRAKTLLPTGVDGQTFLSRLVATLWAGGVDDVVVVTSSLSGEVECVLEGMSLSSRLVKNPHPERGQLSSSISALTAIDRPGVTGMLVALVDIPLVSPGTVRRVLEVFRARGGPIVRPTSGAKHGHPVVFGRAVFDDLRNADEAAGAKSVIRANEAVVVNVPIDDPGAFTDIDTPEDYARFIGPWPFGEPTR